MEYFLLTIYWGFYFTLHSILASNISKCFVKSNFSKIYPFYRIGYNIIALLLLFIVLQQQSKTTYISLFNGSTYILILGYATTVVGGFVGVLAFKNYSVMEFSGLDFNNEPLKPNLQLNTSGLNKFVRHPLYFATLLIVWGHFLSNPTLAILIMNGCISLYLIIGTKLEEKKLINEFGIQYEDYMKTVPMLIPITFFR